MLARGIGEMSALLVRPYETTNSLFSGMIFQSSQVVFRIENLGEKCHLVPSSSVLGTIVGSKSVFNQSLLNMLVIFLKIKIFCILMKTVNSKLPTDYHNDKNCNQSMHG